MHLLRNFGRNIRPTGHLDPLQFGDPDSHVCLHFLHCGTSRYCFLLSFLAVICLSFLAVICSPSVYCTHPECNYSTKLSNCPSGCDQFLVGHPLYWADVMAKVAPGYTVLLAGDVHPFEGKYPPKDVRITHIHTTRRCSAESSFRQYDQVGNRHPSLDSLVNQILFQDFRCERAVVHFRCDCKCIFDIQGR